MEPNLCWKWKKQPRAATGTTVETWKCLIQGWKCKVSKPPCLWEIKQKEWEFLLWEVALKNAELSPFHYSCFPTCSLYYCGTAWLQRSAPGVWQQKERVKGWWMRSISGPWLCCFDPRAAAVIGQLCEKLRISAFGLGLGPGLSVQSAGQTVKAWDTDSAFICLQTARNR